MKPGFALDLSNDGLRLLARRSAGWAELGRVDFADADLETKLAALRGKAETLAPGRVATKLIVPASQILYTLIDAPGPDRAARRAQIAAALDGRTPYAVEDLVFDWSRIGPEVHAAVVARETLEEAEAFAESHGFNPVCFVAAPEPGQFAGEPFFGETSASAAHLPTGERLDRDQDPVQVIGAAEEEDGGGEPPADEEGVAPDAESAVSGGAGPVESEGGSADAEAAPAEAEDLPRPDSSPAESEEDVPEKAAAAAPEPQSPARITEAGLAFDEDVAPAAPDAEPDGPEIPERPSAAETSGPAVPVDAEPAPLAASVGPNITAPLPAEGDGEAGATSGARTENAAPAPSAKRKEKEEEPVSVHPGTLAATLEPQATQAALDAPFIALDDLDELEDAPAPARPAGPAFTTHRPDGPAVGGASDTIHRESRLTLALAQAAPHHAEKSETELSARDIVPEDQGVTAPVLPVPRRAPDSDTDSQPGRKPGAPAARSVQIPLPEARHGTQAQQKERSTPGEAKPAAARAAAPASGTPANPGPSVFGATRAFPDDRPSRLKPGVALAAILVLLLLAVALWWLLLAGPAEEETADPAIAPETTAALPLPDPAPIPSGTADLEATDAARSSTPEAEADLAPPADAATAAPAAGPADTEAAEEEAEAAAIAPPATETIWDEAPRTATGEPEADAPGAPRIARATPVTERPEPLLRPAAPAEATDPGLEPQPLPPPFGTTFEFLPDGTIRPTEDGVITPGGFTLVAGRPPVAPAPRPGSSAGPAAAPAPDPERAPDPAPAAPAATAPDAAAPDSEDAASLPEPVDPAHAAKKPRARPAEVVARAARMAAEAEAARKAEAEARRALEEAIASATPQAVASSQRPRSRPSGLARAVDDAVASAVAESVAAEAASAAQPAPAPAPQAAAAPAPQEAEVDEPEPVAPTPNIPTTVTVARQATIKNAINLRDISLIGVFGSSANRRALVRLPSGRMIKVKVGDRLDGGQVAAIGDSELSYVKRGRTVVLKILKSG